MTNKVIMFSMRAIWMRAGNPTHLDVQEARLYHLVHHSPCFLEINQRHLRQL
jgi:hypothetical protein